MYYVYLQKHTVTKEIYIGKTNNLKRRLSEHNNGEQKSTHRKDGEWKFVYLEVYRSKKDADDREMKLKHHGRAKQELYKRISSSLED
ncbi:MAG: hypothetical protein A3H57_02575 [Candidatus Taylorbacteria bacterium RIFCSPLOWO2_02_FULL_43_11]|uniref:GIY-YIG domain-containing protein n=1 Tax=Candidatus Taylorbacteria bacterium RIFCSPHIGHO2_02_FULL_43_32b TaxID=1802306 RepID=A0A1G2MG53_9BACT|nr:MAG: hypothetical protein A2743_00325 [Candidatus Taylorbacteria bacterium RIFCSPHIGHO2_01_FULL_43_47]OHA22813.1 MAG: hypothetical protein A3C72_02770 [Candidatus Taylorbacteria bacterium RIFCSPHIGHO2_02_FULL_43_32b]OHA30867.1 MAG: hypothetical protein A3B08_01575 [Candidatus Taylorbacteria bacterium RIFCSPLOWO2_01_FULL_43_44]OHA35264.1 MAG: hypothetical protein A3H57_02575 [Candidatus Taylorbacteria bacterium RIFCSPLOWO2_02_FULL_43_11]